MIEVYHTSEPEHIDLVVSNGLKTLQQQADEGLINLERVIKEKCVSLLIPEELIPFRLSTNYFRLNQPPDPVPWVSIMVEENETEVVNNNLEYMDVGVYFSSRMFLSTYLSRSEGRTENLHPITAFPLENRQKIKLQTRSGNVIECTYSAEVIIQQPCIKDFHRYNLA
jgi:hypothetical protein